MKVFNKSKVQTEKAAMKKCPRCGGFGGVASDNGDSCYLCNGYGVVRLSTTGSGWTRAKYSRESKLY